MVNEYRLEEAIEMLHDKLLDIQNVLEILTKAIVLYVSKDDPDILHDIKHEEIILFDGDKR